MLRLYFLYSPVNIFQWKILFKCCLFSARTIEMQLMKKCLRGTTCTTKSYNSVTLLVSILFTSKMLENYSVQSDTLKSSKFGSETTTQQTIIKTNCFRNQQSRFLRKCVGWLICGLMLSSTATDLPLTQAHN